jgi:predicted lipid-binding transport protein (Tim44 family)
MNNGFPLFDIIIFVAIAAFFVLKLRSKLGQRTGHERRPPDQLARQAAEDDGDTVIQLPDAQTRQEDAGDDFSDVEDGRLQAGLREVKLAEPSFTRQGFLEGARTAFDMIIGAYAAGDTETLRPLLASDVYDPLERAAHEREAEDHTLETVLVSIDASDIIEAGVDRRTASVTVRFVTHQINITRDADGKIIDGDPHEAVEVVDIWTFERHTRARDPNWTLVATRSPH